MPCRSLNEATSKLGDGGPVTIEARHDGAGGVWNPLVEGGGFPIILTQAVTLHAPGVYFQQGGPASYFVSIASALEGDPGNPIKIGFVPLPDGGDGDDTGTVAPPLVIYGSTILQNATLAASVGAGFAIVVDGGTLLLGPGPVQIGGMDPGLAGQGGLECRWRQQFCRGRRVRRRRPAHPQ